EVKIFKENNNELKGKNFKILRYGECDLSSLPRNSKLYVLGHGNNVNPNRMWCSTIADPTVPYSAIKHLPFDDWGYAVSAGKKFISIDTVAHRMKEDGLSESNNLSVKLWFCDPYYKAYAIAKRFIEHFKDSGVNLRVDYYLNRLLYTLTIKDGQIHKWARNAEYGNVNRASSVRKSLYCKSDNSGIIVEDSEEYDHRDSELKFNR
ncbi:hypothetical protein, partial [Legionella israelensis]